MRLYLYVIAIFISACTSSSFRSAQPYKGALPRHSYEAHGKGKTAVATQGRFTTAAAFEILEKGGNLADAAVAVSFMQAVERPQSSGLGGGGFLLWGRKIEGKTRVEAWDFRERAPLAAHEEMFIDLKTGKVNPERSVTGPYAVAVPGLVAGLSEFHRSYGKLPWAEVMGPAIELAEKGFDVYSELADALEGQKEVLARNKAAKRIFFNKEEVLKEGDLLKQLDLARTLKVIANKGSDAFYKGSITQQILNEGKHLGLLFSNADFKNYEVKVRPVIKGQLKDWTLYSMPPPSSGGLHVMEILNIIEKDPLKKWGPLSRESVHLTSAAMQRSFLDRAKFLGDPDFVTVPVETLSSKKYAQELRSEISLDKARASSDLKPKDLKLPLESDHTIHFSMIDNEGNAVASTQTINGHFGSGIVVEGTGIVLNNEMDDFAAARGATNLYGATALSAANLVEPSKTPLSSMSPTLIERDGNFVAALGSPSGTRILTCVAQVILNRFVYEMSPWESVAQIRYHHQWQPDQIRVDEPGFPKKLEHELVAMGYKVKTQNLGCRVQYVERNSESGVLTAVSDPRAEGAATVR